MTDVFLSGPLAHPGLALVVFGRDVAGEPASLDGFALVQALGGAAGGLVAREGAVAEGVLVRGLPGGELARLDYYAFGVVTEIHEVTVAKGRIQARVDVAPQGFDPMSEPWDLSEWLLEFGAEVIATAGDAMAGFGVKPASALMRRYPMMLVRGAARVRAGRPPPMTLRFEAGPGDVALTARREPYAAFFAVEEMDLRFRRFNGDLSPEVTRAAFLSGDAVTVLPYDPVRDRVLLVEQFRAGPYARGDVQPWQLEPVAGRIDPGETPEDAARREAVEEAGLALGVLLPVAGYYPSPGICAEFLYSFVALCDLPDGCAGVFGVEGEAEDIRGHLIGFDDLMGLVASGEAGNGPLILTALWLQRERGRLRAAAF